MPVAHEFRHPLDPGYTEEQNHNDYYYNPTLGIDGWHLGDDWSNGSTGGSVYAAAAGEVVWSGYHRNNDDTEGFGNLIVIRHTLDDGSFVHSYYAHLQQRDVNVGADVAIGDPIGTVGNTGASTGPHLHFAIFVGPNAPMPNVNFIGYYYEQDPNIRDRYVDPSLFIDEFQPTYPTSGPDLIIQNVTVADASVAYGDTMTVTYDVVNIGDATAPDHFTRFVFSEDTTLSADDVSSLDTVGTSLAPGQTIRITSTIPTSILSSTGTYNLIVVADHSNSVDEQREDNNAAAPVTVEITGGTGGGGVPDLRIEDVSLDDTTISEGGTTTIRFTVANYGNIDAPASRSGIYVSTDAVFDPNEDDLIDTDFNPALLSGGTDQESEGLQNLAHYAPGTYWLFVVADVNDDVAEGPSEGNNISAGVQLTIQPVGGVPSPDLTAQNLVLGSTTWTAGDSISANWDILNIGNADALSTQSTVYLSTDANVTTDDIEIITDSSTGTMNPGEVNPEGGGSNGSDPYIVPAGLAPGTYYLAVIADDSNAVTESDEGNNTSNVVQVTVEAPMLPNLSQWSIGWNDSQLASGQVPDVEFYIRNDGNAAAGAFSARLYLSQDSQVDAGDILVAEHRFDGLSIDEQTQTVTGNISLQYDIVPGEYYYLLVVDPDGEVTENDETDNIFFSGTGFWNPIDVSQAINVLSVGTDGNDTLYGGPGNDTIMGGPGADTMHGQGGTDAASYAGSATGVTARLDGGTNGGAAAGDVLISIENLTGTALADLLVGNPGANVIEGSGGDDTIYAQGGDDTLMGGDGADTMNGQGGFDTVSYARSATGVTARLDGGTNGGGAAGDVLISIENLTGTAFADLLVGNPGKNVIDGSGGDDVLYAQNGNDVLIGGAGNDTLHGQGGNDRFIFADGFGNDVIMDFRSTKDMEKIDLSAVTAITDFADLTDAAMPHMTQVGADVVIDDFAGNTITLIGVNLADLHEIDFVF